MGPDKKLKSKLGNPWASPLDNALVCQVKRHASVNFALYPNFR
jgi:hypothetical protein